MGVLRAAAVVVAVLVVAVVVVSTGGCVNDKCAESSALPDGERVLAIGDSIFAWSADRCESVPDALARNAGERVVNRAVNGAQVLGGSDERPSIPTQLADAAADDEWDVVVVDGGGNDLNGRCECGACDGVLDELASVDGASGAMAELVDDVIASGARAVLVDYYVLHEGAWYGFDRCGPALEELQARYAALADARSGVTFVDLGDVVTPQEHPEAYTFDNVHPSDAGAELLGAFVAGSLE